MPRAVVAEDTKAGIEFLVEPIAVAHGFDGAGMWAVGAGEISHALAVGPDREGDLVQKWHLADTDFKGDVGIFADDGADVGHAFPEAQRLGGADCRACQRGQRAIGLHPVGREGGRPGPSTARRCRGKEDSPAFGGFTVISSKDRGILGSRPCRF